MARTDLSAADGRAPGHRQERGRSLADTYNLGGWFTAAPRPSEGPVPDMRPEGSGQRPRRPGSLEATRAATAAWQCDVPLQGGEPWPGCAAAAPGSVPCTRCTTTPGGRLVFHVFAALAELIRDPSWRVRAVRRRDRAARPAVALLAWLCRAPDAQAAQIPADSAGALCRRRPRSHATSDPRFSGWYGGRPRRSLICCWMTSGAGRASTV